MADALPIDHVLPQLIDALAQHDQVVLEAPPGAGKTTGVPLALLDALALEGQKILMLEPRRLAVKSAAQRLADTLGEPLGNTVGYRMRLESKASKATRIEVVTEGVLLRMLQDDPGLDGIGLVIFDEFHERSLDADLGLALSLYGRELFREGPALKLLVMSATLDGDAIAKLLGDAPRVTSEGRSYPVDIHYGQHISASDWNMWRLKSHLVNTVEQALTDTQGNILVFLPGVWEINQLLLALQEGLGHASHLSVLPLYGALSLADQQAAIRAPEQGKRKIVLSTAIAETSLTIAGITAVVDMGLSRQALYDPSSAMNRLVTRAVSKAASQQRAGRAGRLGPGKAYRLWSSSQHDALEAFAPPEILQADLTPLALQLISWGIDDPRELEWLDAPPVGAWNQACTLLVGLNAVSATSSQLQSEAQSEVTNTYLTGWALTKHGEQLAQLPTHPRLAHMLMTAAHMGIEAQACDLAALLAETDILPKAEAKRDTTLSKRMALLSGSRGRNSGKVNTATVQRIREQSKRLQSQLKGLGRSKTLSRESDIPSIASDSQLGFLTALAYPDRIAMLRNPTSAAANQYQLSNGRAAALASDHSHRSKWLAVAQLGGAAGKGVDTIYLAEPLDETLFEGALSALVVSSNQVFWDERQNKLCAEKQQRIGKLVLSAQSSTDISVDQRVSAIAAHIKKRGLTLLPWNEKAERLRERMRFLHEDDLQKRGASEWPDVSDQALLANIDIWLAPYLQDVTHINHLKRLNMSEILQGLLAWPQPQSLNELAPERYTVPTGSNIRIDYSQTPPALPVKLQEMFGCQVTPCINHNSPLTVHLLSPAGRPLQITQDLAGFWQSSYKEVQKEMKGRYPKHRWPDDPANEAPSRRSIKHPKKRP